MATIRTPDQRLRVFVSSTLGELAPERAVVREAIEALRLTPVMFELGARPHPPQDLYRSYLEQSDIFVGLYWQRYGWVAPDMDISGLEDEFRLSVGIPRLLYVKEPAEEREERLASLLADFEREATGCYRPFGDPTELTDLIRDDLAILLTERFASTAPVLLDPPSDADRPAARSGPIVGTRTVLFTDVVAGTELRQRLGEDAADELQRRHDELMATAIDGSNGTVVKGLGDGVLAVFDSAADAVAAGVAAQRAVAAHGRRHPAAAFEIRVGISVGDVTWDGGDVHGAAVIEASRLCDAAQGRQVLVAELVRGLARGRGGFGFEPIGELTLKGLGDPVPACLVDFELEALDSDAPVPYPPLLSPPTALPYVGRPALLHALTVAWSAAERGESQAVLIVGEPGAGKTRTASEVARHAFGRGALVLYGRCDDGLGAPYQPFAEALDWQTQHAPHLPLGRLAGELARLLPHLSNRVDGLPPQRSSDAQLELHWLFEAVTSWIGAVSSERGLVLVLDDLHWATKTTIQMLTHVLRGVPAISEARVLVIATYRDTDLDRVHPLASSLAEIRRLPHLSRRSVDPLDHDEVLSFIESAAGHQLDDEGRLLASRVATETEGNPFFVAEVLRHLVETRSIRLDEGRWKVAAPSAFDIPEGVREVIGRRLSQLSPATNEALQVAALVGREVDLDVLGELIDGGADAALDALDEALRARLVDEPQPDRMRFTHALVQATLVDELSASRRRRVHGRIVEVLEDRRPDDLSILAHHAVRAGPRGGDLSQAIDYSIRAGEQAMASRAAADALPHFTTALELIEEDGDPDPVLRLRAKCGLGEAQLHHGNQSSRETLIEVTLAALEAGETDLAVRAALANGRVWGSEVYKVDEERLATLEAVLRHLDDERPERAVILAAIAGELAEDRERLDYRLRLADEAAELAERVGDPTLMARVVVATGFAVNVPARISETVDERAARVHEADLTGDPGLRAGTRAMLGMRLMQHGRFEEARAGASETLQIAHATGSPLFDYHTRWSTAQFAAWDGDLDETRRLADDYLATGIELGEPDALLWWGGVHLGVIEAIGDLDDLAEFWETLRPGYSEVPFWQIGHALLVAERDGPSAARPDVDRLRLTDPGVVPLDIATFSSWTRQCELALLLDADSYAADMAATLAPHRHHWASIGLWVDLPMAIAIAECQLLLGDHRDAFDAAAEGWTALAESGIRCNIPRGAVWVARVLRAIDTAESRSLADQVVRHARREAEAMGMARRIEQLDSLA